MRLKEKGITMVELMVGVAIFLVVILASLYTFIGCILLNEASSNLVIAANDAQSVLEQIKVLSFTEISGYVPPAFNNLTNETVVLSRSIQSNIATVTVNIAWQERQNSKDISLSTYFTR